MKIKLTKEQLRGLISGCGCHDWKCKTLDTLPEFTIFIDESQIIKEKSNLEKWGKITRPFLVKILAAEEMFKNRTRCNFLPPPDYKEMEELNKSVETEIGVLNEFLSKHYNADAAYKEVVGNG